MQRKGLVWIEVGIGVLGIASAIWPLSRFCTGWPLGHDCEAWHILGVNLFAPLGVVFLMCAVWTARTPSRTPHLVLGAAFVAIVGRFALYALL